MVYGGKLSKSCAPCRTRRARCDLQQPGCGQCQRAQRKCHGYRDTTEFRINDSTENVIEKFKNKTLKNAQNASERRRKKEIETPKPPVEYIDPALLHCPALSDPLETRASCYFRATFVVGQSRSFKYLESYYQQGVMSSHLSLSIQAVGLACLSKAVRSTKLEIHARRIYVLALNSINAALASPVVSRHDTTMSAVLLLDEFERLIPPTNRSSSAWSRHLEGAAALMKVRGPKQYETQIGLEMFAQMSSHFFVTCMEHEISLPEDFLSLRSFAANFVDTEDLVWRLTDITIPYIAFRAAVRNGDLYDSSAIISTAARLDGEMATLLNDLPPGWEHQTVNLLLASNLVLESHYDIYAVSSIAEALNSIRAGRIALLDIIIQEGYKVESTLEDYFFTLSLSPECKLEVDLAKENLHQTTSAICATVPQLAGYLPYLDDQRIMKSDTTECFDFPKISTTTALSSYSLLWPLFACANSTYATPLTRDWIIRQLRFIGEFSDISKAIELADILDSGIQMDIWKAYAMIGCICYYS
ncbi:Zn2/Cys6 DNA-binding protein [Glarea lozoyensis ATCC 20868]|uniref:Zn2/Cys6 DNA-binding protein n=1 Tax=Glarea lozoyensis (strain ATCC 20868 / MF5171) TaxID=1116229 RepID=S3DN92_GLAL2|nr:Zn2/Cys6 DNA-binding protein [Glarea lozoyensis ATCC 20868]EPE33566.1 Zn2/Cys6 DNA-binding protein [Glarea lozoyensis ATCC 20868]